MRLRGTENRHKAIQKSRAKEWGAFQGLRTAGSVTPGAGVSSTNGKRAKGQDQVAAGTALRVEAAGLTVAVFNVDGQFYVTDDACTHGPGSLSEGYIEGDVVECNFHNGQFNIRTGEVVLPPGMIPMKTYPTTVEDGKVYIEV